MKGGSNMKNIRNKQKLTIGLTAAGLGVLIAVAVFLSGKNSPGVESTQSSLSASAAGSLTIHKSEVTGTPRFYPVTIDGVKMEIIAVKASDGTIRTAFNTCQVCYSSGRGYYKLQGSTLVCQNCGNRFTPNQISLEKGGCNPVPIGAEERTENTDSIVVSDSYLRQAEQIFAVWKKL